MQKSVPYVSATLAVCSFFLSSPVVNGAVLVSGNNTQVNVSGTNGLSGIAMGYDATNGAITGSGDTLVMEHHGGGIETSNALYFSNAPYTEIGASLYFVFVLDANETPGEPQLKMTSAKLIVGRNDIWSATDDILLNSAATKTLTPTGSGADMALFVPVAAFNGLNLFGSDTFKFHVGLIEENGGNEKWYFTDRGITTPVSYFAASQIISDPAGVPEPSTLVFALLGGCFMSFRAFRAYRR